MPNLCVLGGKVTAADAMTSLDLVNHRTGLQPLHPFCMEYIIILPVRASAAEVCGTVLYSTYAT